MWPIVAFVLAIVSSIANVSPAPAPPDPHHACVVDRCVVIAGPLPDGAWQRDGYLLFSDGRGAGTGPGGVETNGWSTTRLAADSTLLDVVVRDASGLAVPATLRVDGEAKTFCGELRGFALPPGARVATVAVEPASVGRCEGAGATSGMILLRANGAWSPRVECTGPHDLVQGDPACAPDAPVPPLPKARDVLRPVPVSG